MAMDLRARKAGVALKSQKKMEERYDEEEKLGTPERIKAWLNAALEGEHPQCNGATWRKLQWHLRDGVALCKFICKLRVAAGMEPIKFMAHAHTQFVAMENISLFNKAAIQYGLPEEASFQSVDLYEGNKAPFLNVVNCLNQLGFIANKKDFTPSYEPPSRQDDQ